jgi:hypothetical protein
MLIDTLPLSAPIIMRQFYDDILRLVGKQPAGKEKGQGLKTPALWLFLETENRF